jgi:hypothetical protein
MLACRKTTNNRMNVQTSRRNSPIIPGRNSSAPPTATRFDPKAQGRAAHPGNPDKHDPLPRRGCTRTGKGQKGHPIFGPKKFRLNRDRVDYRGRTASFAPAGSPHWQDSPTRAGSPLEDSTETLHQIAPAISGPTGSQNSRFDPGPKLDAILGWDQRYDVSGNPPDQNAPERVSADSNGTTKRSGTGVRLGTAGLLGYLIR